MNEATKGNVLFVDDDKFLADMYGMKFTSAGYTVQTCLSVAEALAALKAGFAPDAIVFDLTMPERDGFSFLDELSQSHVAPGATLIALTNMSDPAERSKAESLGVHRYIVKASMIPSEVVQAVAEEIAKRKK
ncbi:response regulator [Candidatus Kaiserbacteria bacterium]|nr:response regulator [Candidatus Kaiserbacteria bacterium]